MSPRPAKPLSGGIAAALSATAAALAELPAPGMIIGGIAVILHGVPRVTRDVDATVSAGALPLDALVDHLRGHGIVPRIQDAAQFARANQVLLARHEDSGRRATQALGTLRR